MSSIDDIPIVDTNPKKLVTIHTLKRELNKHILETIELFYEIFSNPKNTNTQRMNAAKNYADLYFKVDKRIDEAVLVEQQKRINAMKIRRESNEGGDGYKSASLDLDYKPSESNYS